MEARDPVGGQLSPVLTGTTSDAFFGELELGIPEIAEHALEAARGGLL